MNGTFLLYLLTRLDSIQFICSIILILFSVVVSLTCIISIVENNNSTFKKYVTPYLYIPIIAAIILVFIPSKDESVFILAGSNIMEIAKSNDTKRIANKSVEVFENYLNQMIKEEKK